MHRPHPRARLRRAVERLLGPPPDKPLLPPYAFVQADVEQRLPGYIGHDPELVVIVGAWHGDEVVRMLPRYPACRFVCLEPGPGDFLVLRDRFAGEPRVECHGVAASDRAGTALFRGTHFPGTASMLPINDSRYERGPSFDAPTVPLDELLDAAGPVDCLWVDVQGAELRVLKGAPRVLARTEAVLLEVGAPYVGAPTLRELDDHLGARGFQLASLGTGHGAVSGNALWVRTSPAG